MLLYRSFGSFFHLVSSVHFIIVELCWHICSKSHFDLSLAFWLWASVISHFPRQQTLRQICVQEYSPDQYLKGVKEAGLGRARGWIAYQLPVKLQQILVNSSWDSHSGLSWAGARDSAFVSQCHSVIGSALRMGCYLGWGNSLHLSTEPSEGLSWNLSATNTPKSSGYWVLQLYRGGGGHPLQASTLHVPKLCVPQFHLPPTEMERGTTIY